MTVVGIKFCEFGAVEMSQEVKMLATKADDLSNPWDPHRRRGEGPSSLFDLHRPAVAYTRVHAYI